MVKKLLKVFTYIMGFTLISPTILNAQWDNAVLDSVTQNLIPDRLNGKQSIDIDEFDNVHVVWTSQLDLGSVINYNRRSPGGDWGTVITVSLAGNAYSPVSGLMPGLSRPVVAYILEGVDNQEIMVTYNSGTEWETVQITETDYPVYSPTLKVDDSGLVHLAWIGEIMPDVFKIFYARLTIPSNDFQIEELSQSSLGGFGSGADPFINYSPEVGVVIGYRGGDFSSYDIYLAQKENGQSDWIYDIVPTPNLDDYTNSIVVKDNRIYALVSGNDGFGIGGAGYFLWKPNGGNWSTPEKVNFGSNGVIGSSLFIDEDGSAHCVWEELSGNFLLGNIHYSTNKNGSWESESLLNTGNLHFPNLAFDSGGNGFLVAEQEDVITFDFDKIEVVLYGGLEGVNATNNEIFSNNLVQIFPNPTSEGINIKSIDSQIDMEKFLLFDANGKLVFSQIIEGDNYIDFNNRLLLAGIYFYNIIDQKKRVFTGKIDLK